MKRNKNSKLDGENIGLEFVQIEKNSAGLTTVVEQTQKHQIRFLPINMFESRF
jgi:hypothetical protein